MNREGESLAKLCEKSAPGRGNCKCKGPEVGAYTVGNREERGGGVTRVERERRRKRKREKQRDRDTDRNW